MILGTKKSFLRHAFVAVFSMILIFVFKEIHLSAGMDIEWTAVYKAFADTAFVNLSIALGIGPLVYLYKPFVRLLTWRREFGVWFAIMALAHGGMILFGMYGYFGSFYGVVSNLNWIIVCGIVGLAWGLVLAFTSSDRAVKYIGIGSWKWIHSFAYVIFYLVAMHALSLILAGTSGDFVTSLVVTLAILIPVLQLSGFVKSVYVQRRRLSLKKKNDNLFTKINGVKKVAKGTYQVDFDTKGKKFDFEAGQHTGVWIKENKHNDPKGKFRLFSIVSSPNEKDIVSVAFRETGSGFKKQIVNFEKGNEVELMGASGYFVLPKSSTKKVVFVAGGIGITPFVSMAKFAAETKKANNIDLYYINNGPETAAYVDELNSLARKNKNFSFHNYYERDKFKKDIGNIKDADKMVWYVAGPSSLVSDIKWILSMRGVHPTDIITEEFTGY